MKQILVFAALFALSGATVAAGDVVATIAVKKGTTAIYSQTTTFHNMTSAEAAALEKSAMPQLNAASQRQNKAKCGGCDWSIEWTWGSNPTIVTEQMSFIGVNKTLREGVRWLDDRVTAAEANRQRGKVKPWGN